MSARKLLDKFQVAFSFAGEQRDFVRAIAQAVEKELGSPNVFFDEWYEHYLAGHDADLKLQEIYLERSTLVVVFVAEQYGRKPWTLAEHEAIRARVMKARQAGVELGVLPIRVGNGDLKGLQFNTLVPDVRNRSATEAARLIIDRLNLINASSTDPRAPIREPPEERDPEIWAREKGVRAAVSKLPRTGEYCVGREKELAILDEAWANPHTCVVQIIAAGGVGKTQLVKKWRQRVLEATDLVRDEIRVFDWSFYMQGTQQQASTESFFDRALEWFGETNPEKLEDPWEKGSRLTELVRKKRTLLILDGLEPLQHPPGPCEGALIDPAMEALLRGLSELNSGLCIVTSRVSVPDLTSMSEPQRRTIDLTALSETDGAMLLTLYEVRGTDDELRQASRDYGGNALALILLGTYLRDRFGGDVLRRNEVSLLRGVGPYSVHARNVMEAYVSWFQQEPDEPNERIREINRASVSILHLIGLFNRPAEADCLSALRAAPPIPKLTEPLFEWEDTEELWHLAVSQLRKARLLADIGDDCVRQQHQTLDAHALVREYFAEQLSKHFKCESLQAHQRLFQHLASSVPELPDNVSDMKNLYHAVVHGCKAGLEEETFRLYQKRIYRENEYFSIRKLRTYTLELHALQSFFRRRWTSTSRNLRLTDQATVLRWTGFVLRAIGRLPEAEEALRESVNLARKIQEWSKAAMAGGNLSELYLFTGSLGKAEEHAKHAVDYAEKSGMLSQRVGKRANVAYVLSCSGRNNDAIVQFEQAARIYDNEHGAENEFPLLAAFWHADAMLYDLESQVAGQQAAQNLSALLKKLCKKLRPVEDRISSNRANSQLAGALTLLLDARRFVLEQRIGSKSKDVVRQACDSAIRELRQSRQVWLQLRGLLTTCRIYVWLHSPGEGQRDLIKAQKLLIEARELVNRHGMVLHLPEMSLLEGRIALLRNDATRAIELAADAEQAIKAMGYHRLDTALTHLKCAATERL